MFPQHSAGSVLGSVLLLCKVDAFSFFFFLGHYFINLLNTVNRHHQGQILIYIQSHEVMRNYSPRHSQGCRNQTEYSPVCFPPSTLQ